MEKSSVMRTGHTIAPKGRVFPAALGILIVSSLAASGTSVLTPIRTSSQQPAQPARECNYLLLEGSELIDDCYCGRPTIFIPMRGTFRLRLLEENPLFARYELWDVSFTAGPFDNVTYQVTGSGQYQLGGEVALLQDLFLELKVDNGFTDKTCSFTNDTRTAERLWPMIGASLTQSNGPIIQFYRLRIAAAPVREIWFSTARGFTSGRLPLPNVVTDGDLLSSTGRIVRRNADLTQRLGIRPPVPDLGLDAVDILPGGEIAFSLAQDASSQTLGQIQHGDLLWDRGGILKRNQDLTKTFGPMPPVPDIGLDAVQIDDNGLIYFSTQTNLFGEVSGPIQHGDIATSQGAIWKRNQDLLARFHPPDPKHDYGLDALYIWPLPSGEVWFSTTEGFADQQLNQITPGDLLSDQGYIVFRNLELLSAFAPLEDVSDFGLDALYVVTDASPPADAPRIGTITADPQTGAVFIQWAGKGRVFQIERAADAAGPFLPAGPIAPQVTCEDPGAIAGAAQSFYRVRQW